MDLSKHVWLTIIRAFSDALKSGGVIAKAGGIHEDMSRWDVFLAAPKLNGPRYGDAGVGSEVELPNYSAVTMRPFPKLVGGNYTTLVGGGITRLGDNNPVNLISTMEIEAELHHWRGIPAGSASVFEGPVVTVPSVLLQTEQKLAAFAKAGAVGCEMEGAFIEEAIRENLVSDNGGAPALLPADFRFSAAYYASDLPLGARPSALRRASSSSASSSSEPAEEEERVALHMGHERVDFDEGPPAYYSLLRLFTRKMLTFEKAWSTDRLLNERKKPVSESFPRTLWSYFVKPAPKSGAGVVPSKKADVVKVIDDWNERLLAERPGWHFRALTSDAEVFEELNADGWLMENFPLAYSLLKTWRAPGTYQNPNNPRGGRSHEIQNLAAKSDVIRLLLLAKKGGVWLDGSTILTQHPEDLFPEILDPEKFLGTEEEFPRSSEKVLTLDLDQPTTGRDGGLHNLHAKFSGKTRPRTNFPEAVIMSGAPNFVGNWNIAARPNSNTIKMWVGIITEWFSLTPIDDRIRILNAKGWVAAEERNSSEGRKGEPGETYYVPHMTMRFLFSVVQKRMEETQKTVGEINNLPSSGLEKALKGKNYEEISGVKVAANTLALNQLGIYLWNRKYSQPYLPEGDEDLVLRLVDTPYKWVTPVLGAGAGGVHYSQEDRDKIAFNNGKEGLFGVRELKGHREAGFDANFPVCVKFFNETRKYLQKLEDDDEGRAVQPGSFWAHVKAVAMEGVSTSERQGVGSDPLKKMFDHSGDEKDVERTGNNCCSCCIVVLILVAIFCLVATGVLLIFCCRKLSDEEAEKEEPTTSEAIHDP